jgi:hypothetical protein
MIMKKITLLLLALTGTFASAQDYSTNNVPLGTNYGVKFDTNPTTVTMTLSGPDTDWFAVGLNTSGGMLGSAGKDCIVYTGGTISDRYFATSKSVPLIDATQSWTVTSNIVDMGRRTVIATRALTNGDTNDYQFTNSAVTVSMLWAGGLGTDIAYHDLRGTASRAFVLSNDAFYIAGFKMYPNPADEIFAIELPQGTDAVTVKLYDVLGKNVLTKEITALQNKLDITSLRAGNYIVKVSGDEKEYSTNLIIE